jgi:hypothetical protein
LDSLSALKPALVDNFEKWRIQNPTEAALVDKQTPNVIQAEKAAARLRIEEEQQRQQPDLSRGSSERRRREEETDRSKGRRDVPQRSDTENRARYDYEKVRDRLTIRS